MTQDTARFPRNLLWGSALLIVLLAVGRLWWLPANAPLNVNEGWNAAHTLRLFGDGTLYPSPDALIANNYPPLSFVIVGALARTFGDPILVGRLVALCSEIATGAAAWVLIARLADRYWATAGALLFALFAVTVLRKYLAIDDPQWLAQAVMAWALVLLIRPGDRTLRWRHVLAAAALTVSGGLVKHNLVAMPFAATLYLALTDRRAFLLWVAAGATLAVLACATLFALWGSTVFVDVLAPARSYSMLRMAAHGGPLLLAVLPGVLAARPVFSAWQQDRRLLLPCLLFAAALPTAIIQRSGEGVGINATFETFFALAILVSAGCRLQPARPLRWLVVAAAPALVLIPVAGMADAIELGGREAAVRQVQPFVARIAAAPGPVACDDQALCYWAGRQSAFDFFAVKQRLLAHDAAVFQAALERGDFAMIAMRSVNPDWHENRIIPAIRARYRTIYAAGGTELLVPR